jgi:uncharacterized protein (TIGR03089 family)
VEGAVQSMFVAARRSAAWRIDSMADTATKVPGPSRRPISAVNRCWSSGPPACEAPPVQRHDQGHWPGAPSLTPTDPTAGMSPRLDEVIDRRQHGGRVQPTTTALTALIDGHVTVKADRPLLTYYDDVTGERTELSGAALGSWAARTASMLRDGCRMRTGDRAAVLLPPHWQTAAVLLGAWSAGVAVSFHPWATAGLTVAGQDTDEPVDAVFVARHRLDSWLETVPQARHRFVLGLGRDGVVMDEVPDGYRDYVAEVRRYGDRSPAYHEIRHTDPASPDGTSYEEWAALAHDFAAQLGLEVGDRLLVDVSKHEQPVMWLLAPLSVGASVVLCANLDRDTLDDRIAAEGISHVL